MDFDPSALIGGGAIVAVIVTLVFWVISLFVFYLVTRAAVAGGLRSHQLWMERNRPGRAGQPAPEVATPQQ